MKCVRMSLSILAVQCWTYGKRQTVFPWCNAIIFHGAFLLNANTWKMLRTRRYRTWKGAEIKLVGDMNRILIFLMIRSCQSENERKDDAAAGLYWNGSVQNGNVWESAQSQMMI